MYLPENLRMWLRMADLQYNRPDAPLRMADLQYIRP